MNFTDFNFNSKILQAVTELGYVIPTPIQSDAIPKILEGLDLIASAQTGTGKTAAFILPALQKISMLPKLKKGAPRLLVLVPTRELAQQLATEAKKYSKYLPDLKTVCIYGGVPFPQQERALYGRYDLLIATPGRLIDHMERGRIDLSKLTMLVFDEADRMLDMGFIDAVQQIAAEAPKERQTLMFSATFNPNVLRLSRELQNNPIQIEIKKDPQTALNIEQRLYYADGLDHKVDLLNHILGQPNLGQVIVFTSTKIFANDLSERLNEFEKRAVAIHGDMNQRQRTRALEMLKMGKTQILVATDVAARGIDVAKLSHVINFDLPMQADDYIHRIGRTGRAGEKGIASSFATHKDRHLIPKIEDLTKQPMVVHTIAGLEPKKRSDSKPHTQHRSKKWSSRPAQKSFSQKRAPFKKPKVA